MGIQKKCEKTEKGFIVTFVTPEGKELRLHEATYLYPVPPKLHELFVYNDEYYKARFIEQYADEGWAASYVKTSSPFPIERLEPITHKELRSETIDGEIVLVEGVEFTRQPNLTEVIRKVNEIVDYLNGVNPRD